MNNLYISHRLLYAQTYSFWAIRSKIISLFRVTFWFDTVYNVVTRWMNFRKIQLHEHWGGGAVKLFSSVLIDRTCDLYRTPVPPLHPHSYHKFYSTMVILFLAVYFRLSSCTHNRCMLYANLKMGFGGSLFHRCVSMICFCPRIKGYCWFPACKLGWIPIQFQKCVLCICHAENCSLRFSGKVPIWYRQIGPQHEKTCLLSLWIIKVQTSMCICAVWSAHLFFAHWKVSYLDLLQVKYRFSSYSL